MADGFCVGASVAGNRSGVLRMQKLRTPPSESQGLSNVPSF